MCAEIIFTLNVALIKKIITTIGKGILPVLKRRCRIGGIIGWIEGESQVRATK